MAYLRSYHFAYYIDGGEGMKKEVKLQLKEKGLLHLFTDERYNEIKLLMSYAMSKDKMLKEYLSISPDFKVNFISDHIIKYYG